MTSASSLTARLSLLTLGAVGMFFLSGCAMQTSSPATSTAHGLVVQGTVFGGQTPIAGAKVYLLAAGTTGYGSAVTSVLGSASNTSADTTSVTGTTLYYTTTSSDGTGSFSITGDYTCIAGQQVYLLAKGGNAGSGVNSNIGLMAGLGQCPPSGTFISTIPTINIDEVTTIATAFSLAGYAIDPFHIGASSTTMATAGIANAMGNVSNVVDITVGQAFTQPASTTGQSGNNANAVAPYNKINALADILAACINGANNNSSCQTLDTAVTSNGNTATGANPTDTATAAIYMAKNQWNAPAALFTLLSGTSPFTTTLTTATDLSLAVTYYGQGSGGAGITADANGNVFASVNGSGGTLTRFSPQGAYGTPTSLTLVPPAGGTAQSVGPQDLAIDSTGNVWVTTVNAYSTKGGMQFYVFNPTTVAQISGSPYYPTNAGVAALNTAYGFGFDASGNVYAGNRTATATTSGSVVEVSSTGVYESTLSSTTPGATFAAVAKNGDVWVGAYNATTSLYYFPLASAAGQTPITLPGCVTTLLGQTGEGLAIDASNNAWFSCNTGVAKVTTAGTVTSTLTATHGGGTIAIDSSGNVFQACGVTGGCVNEFNSSGTLLTPATGYSITTSTNATASNQLYLTIDISGNVWATGANRVYQMLGVASPTAGPVLPANIQALP